MAGGGPDGRRWSRWPAVVPMADGAPLVWAAGIFLARGRGAPCAAGTPLGQKPTPPPGASRGSPGTSPPAPAQVWSAPFAPRRVASRYLYLASRRPPPQLTPRRRRPCFARLNPPRGSARLSKRPRSGPKILISGSQNPRSLKKIEGRRRCAGTPESGIRTPPPPFAPRRDASLYFYFASRRPPL